MSYEILLQPQARKEFLALPSDIAKKITQALHTLEQKPRSHQSIKLSGGEGYRLRVGDYRILYEIDDSAGRSSCIVSSIAENPIDSPAETMLRSPAQGGQQAHRPSPVARRPHVRLRTWPPMGGEISLHRTPARRAGKLGKWGDPSEQWRKSYKTVGKTQPRLRIRGIIPEKPPVFIASRPGIAFALKVQDCGT